MIHGVTLCCLFTTLPPDQPPAISVLTEHQYRGQGGHPGGHQGGHQGDHQGGSEGAERQRRETERGRGSVEFVHPDLKQELGKQGEDPSNPWVWLTSYSRIPVSVSRYCRYSSPAYSICYISAGGNPGVLQGDQGVLPPWQGGKEGPGRAAGGRGAQGRGEYIYFYLRI